MNRAHSTQNPGLHLLDGYSPDAQSQALLDQAMKTCTGSALWRKRKLAEATELLALSRISPPGRMRVDFLDLRDELRAVCELRVPVPCRDDSGEVRIADRAVIGIRYPEEAVSQQLPGYSYVELILPRGVWHPSIAVPISAGLGLTFSTTA